MDYGKCGCGFPVKVMTSWTDDNPGRRFFACARRIGGCCNLFEWIDPEMCARSKIIIPGLLRKINKLQQALDEAKPVKKRQKMRPLIWCIIGVIILALLLLVCFGNEKKKKTCDA